MTSNQFSTEASYKMLENFGNFHKSIYVKPYASCRHSHPAVDCALYLRTLVSLKNIEKIIVYTYQLAVGGHDQKIMDSLNSAKMSTSYAVATALLSGNVGLEALNSEVYLSSEIKQVLHLIEIKSDERLTELSKYHRGARVEIIEKNG